mgnify:CR=1 FL=1
MTLIIAQINNEQQKTGDDHLVAVTGDGHQIVPLYRFQTQFSWFQIIMFLSIYEEKQKCQSHIW